MSVRCSAGSGRRIRHGPGRPDYGARFHRRRSCSIALTVPEMPDQEPLHQIEALYVDLIARARRWFYAESQYFASRKVAEAIAKRLAELDGPEFVIVHPTSAQGWLEPLAMNFARARLVEALHEHDPHRRLRLYHPYTASGEPIYVHAKVTVIDDDVLRIGSSNFNNRSLRLDTECDVVIDAHGAPMPISARLSRAFAIRCWPSIWTAIVTRFQRPLLKPVR